MLPPLLLCSAAIRPTPLPPSLPPLATRPLTSVDSPAHVAIKYTYVWHEGFIGSGGDVRPPTNATVHDALRECDALPRCRGITYEGSNATTLPQRVYFKMSVGVATAKGWSTWIKTANVTRPAVHMAVGGSSNLEVLLRQDFYTVQNLSRSGENWSFTRPLDDASVLPFCAHLGDLSLRVRSASNYDAGAWPLFSTIELGSPAVPLDLGKHARGARGEEILAAQDISKLLAASNAKASLPFRVVRYYARSADGASLVVRFNLTSLSDSPVEIGALGMALPESDGHPPAGIESVVWNDPHIGGGHGFVEFVRVVDDEATLLATPADRLSSPFEAWRPMLEDLGNGDAYEWTVASKAWAEEWARNGQFPFINMSDALKATYPPFAINPETPWPATDGKHGMPLLASPGVGAGDPWNRPTSITVPAGGALSVGIQLRLAKSGPRSRDATLHEMGSAIVHGVPGFVLPTDLSSAQLLVRPPAGAKVTHIATDPNPAVNASLSFSPLDHASSSPFRSKRVASAGLYVRYSVKASGYGRARVNISFSDGTNTTVHYHVLPPLHEQVAALGSHLANVAWLPRNYPDPFGRSASVMPWDRSACPEKGGKPCGHVLNDARAYDAGLSDDAGGGNPLCLASKVRAAPTAHEASRVDEYIQWTLYGVKPDVASPPLRSLQIREDEGANAEAVDGVRMTMFYYAADLNNHSSGHFNWSYTEADKCHMPFGGPTWCMTENMANATYRGFNYPHQIASYWAMYTVARHTNYPTRMEWHWYLYRAGKTALKLGRAGVGFMDGTVAREVLYALLVEGAAGNATLQSIAEELRANMQARQIHWTTVRFPYGSEFGFDTTGQEEVVVWNLYFGNETVAKRTVDHILSYMRSSPTWAYHGGSRSWGDNGNNGKYLATFGAGAADRGNMHYRSGLNMIPLIEWYRLHPEEGITLLEISMGAITGQMTNIDPSTGATSMMFHATPHMLAFDPHSGDYGLGYFGNALESGAYFVDDADLGVLCYLCDWQPGKAGGGRVVPRDAYGRAAFIEPLGLYLTTECGQMVAIDLPQSKPLLSNRSRNVRHLNVTFASGSPCPYLRLLLTKTAKARPGSGFAVAGAALVRNAYQITISAHGGETVAMVVYQM